MRAPATEPNVVLRARELEQVMGILLERRPAVVVVTGPPGMGKTSLLAEVHRRAESQGWLVAGGAPGDALQVGAHTRDREFRGRVLAATAEAGQDDGRREARGQAALETAPGPQVSDVFLEELARRAPILLLIDDFRPDAAVAPWFLDFLGRVPDCGGAVVVVVAVPSASVLLDPVATDRLELGELTSDQVRDGLRHIAERIQPPLDPHELEVYGEEVRTPLMLDSLIRVLALACPGDARTDGST